MASQIKLYGKVFIKGNIRAMTGLHIGGGDIGINIGGMDNPVIRNTRTNQPYIPGSSIKGKMRSLSEKLAGVPPNFPPGQRVQVHVCNNQSQYETCDVCHIFGVPGDKEFATPTLLSVRDVMLDEKSLEGVKTDLAYTEIKWEATIDRITSAANPRQLERVPEGAIFKDFEFCYGVYGKDDICRIGKVFAAMQLVEDDYLGGSGTRGSGKIRFEDMKISCRPGEFYGTTADPLHYEYDNGEIILRCMKDILDRQEGHTRDSSLTCHWSMKTARISTAPMAICW